MERIAFILDTGVIYWSSVVLTLAAAAAVCGFLALYLGRGGSVAVAAVCVPMSVLLAVICSRSVHWYFRSDSYSGWMQALQDLSGGGFALAGVFAACAATALLLRLTRISRDLPRMLDCMSIAGCGGIALGRLSAFFNTANRGFLTKPGNLPWICAVVNPVSGDTEYRLATFLLQSVAAGGICGGLFLFYLTAGRKKHYREGDACLLFLLGYGASQVLLDSTRYDPLAFRSNGFVGVVQVLGALAMGLAAVVFSLRLVKTGWRKWYPLLWVAMAALFAGGGYMEYYVQRHGEETLFAYMVMGGCLLALVMLIGSTRSLAVRKEKSSLEIRDEYYGHNESQ